MDDKFSKAETKECEECAGRGWIGGALRGRDADGVSFVNAGAYKIVCPRCNGTGQSNN